MLSAEALASLDARFALLGALAQRVTSTTRSVCEGVWIREVEIVDENAQTRGWWGLLGHLRSCRLQTWLA